MDNAAAAVESSRANLRSGGETQLSKMQEEASKLTDPALARDFVTRTQKLRDCYADYDNAAGAVADQLTQASRAMEDIRIAVEANRTPAVVDLTKDSLGKAVSALKKARDKIPDARKALAELRANQPQPAAQH